LRDVFAGNIQLTEIAAGASYYGRSGELTTPEKVSPEGARASRIGVQ
jgi:hypothetical protein